MVVWSLAPDDGLELPIVQHESLVELCKLAGLHYSSTVSRRCRGEPIFYRPQHGPRIRCRLHRIEIEDHDE